MLTGSKHSYSYGQNTGWLSSLITTFTQFALKYEGVLNETIY